MATDYQIRPITSEEYHAMVAAGILREDERIELLDGELIALPPIGDDHAFSVRKLIAILSARFAGRAIIDVQNPVALDRYSEPQPDIMLLEPRADWYRSKPKAADVLLVVEVSDSTLRYDRGRKLRAYARTGIRELWIVNLVDGQVEQYRDPSGERYTRKRRLERGQTLAPAAFPDDAIEIDAFLP